MLKATKKSPGTVAILAALCLGLLATALPSPAPAAEIVVLRSGNAPVGNPDPQITMWAGAAGAPLSPNTFQPIDFQSACAGLPAQVINPHPAWTAGIACDPQARWISVDPNGGPASALYCHPFTVQTCCIQQAIMTFCWAGDDALGDGIYGGPNLDGVYINGQAVSPSINTGSYAVPTIAGGVDVTALLHCGTNYLQVYNRDAAFVISGIIYNATFDITECFLPAVPTTFGGIKALYR